MYLALPRWNSWKKKGGGESWIGEVQSLDLQWVQLSNHWAIVTHCCYSETKALWFQVARTWETNWGEVSLQWLDRKRGSETGENLPGIGMRLYVKFEVSAFRNVSMTPGHTHMLTETDTLWNIYWIFSVICCFCFLFVGVYPKVFRKLQRLLLLLPAV